MNTADKQQETFRLLYPLFKDEVFKRREQMMLWTTFAGTFLVTVLIILLTTARWATSGTSIKWFAISGLAVFFGLYTYLILQQAERHSMAKQQLIELEQQLGLYQNGWQPKKDGFYPQNWQSDWKADQSVKIYLTILSTLTMLVVCAVLFRT